MARPLVHADGEALPSFGPLAFFGVVAHLAMVVLDARLVGAAMAAVNDVWSTSGPLVATGLTSVVLLHAVLLALAITLAWQVSQARAGHTMGDARRAARASGTLSMVMAASLFLVPLALAALGLAG